MATDAASLMQQGKCYDCLLPIQRSIAELALLAQILLASKPMADVTAAGLVKAGACYDCLTDKQREIALLALLALISAAGGAGGGACIIGGLAAPVGVPPCNFSVYIQQPGPNFGLWLGDTVNGWGNVIAQGP